MEDQNQSGIRPEEHSQVTLEVPVKKRKKGFVVLIAILVIAAITGSCVLLIGPKKIMNTLYQTFASDSVYYAWLEKNNANELLEKLLTGDLKEHSYSADINISLDSNIVSVLSMATDTIRVQVTNEQKGQQIQNDIILSYGENHIMDVTTLTDKANNELYIQFPELSEQFLAVDFGEGSSAISLLSAGKAPKLISKYLKIFIDNLDLSVELEKSQDIKVGELSVTGTKLTVTYPLAKAMKELSHQFADMKADDNMFQALSEGGMKKSEYKTLMESLSSKTVELSSSFDEDDIVTITCYVSDEGVIVGRIIEFPVNNTTYKISYVFTVDNKIATNLEVNGLSMVLFNGSFQANKEVGEITAVSAEQVDSASEYLDSVGKDTIYEFVNNIITNLGLSSFSSYLEDYLPLGDNEDSNVEEGSFEFTLGEYTGISVQKPSSEITEDEIQEEIAAFVELYSEMIPITDRDIVKDGDYVNIDYVGTIDGVEFDGGSATDTELGIGTGTFIDGFEDQLIGAKVGDTVVVKVAFPETYGNTEVAGKDAEFTVKINVIGIREFTDEFVAYNTEYTTTDEYREYVYQGLVETNEYNVQSAIEEEILAQIVANTTFTSVNQSEIDAKEAEMLSTYEYYASYYGVDLETFASIAFGMTLEEFYADINYYADLYVKETYVLEEIAKIEGLALSDEEYEERLKEAAKQYQYESPEELETAYGGREVIEKVLLEDKTMEFLRSSANIY